MDAHDRACAIANVARAFHQEYGHHPRWLYLGHAEWAALQVAPQIEIPGMKQGHTTLQRVETSSHCLAVGLDARRPGEWVAMPLW